MAGYGPQERDLFETAGSQLYEEVVSQGGLDEDDPRIAPGGEHRAAFVLLRDLGLVTDNGGDGMWVAVDPATVQSQVVAPMGQQGAQLITESASWAKAFSSLAHTWRRSPGAVRGPFSEVRGEAIAPFLAAVVADAEDEVLTAQPQHGRAGRGGIEQLGGATESELSALRRGVKIRTLYQHAARRSTVTHKYVAAVTAEGAEVRTLDEFFNRLIVVDRRLAVIPGHEGLAVALAIREPSLVAYLVDMFERSWERARPFTNREASMVRDIAAEQRAMTIRMLIEGHADPAGAKRLGVSPRTYAAYVAELKSEFDVETRFQLGYAMGQMGVSGNERNDDTSLEQA